MSFDIDSGLSYCPWNGRGNGKEKEKDKGTPLIPPLLLIANLLWDLNTALFTNSCASVLGHDLRVPKTWDIYNYEAICKRVHLL
jgi:hypothetical protein